MDDAERDAVSIKRDALLAKKRILDFVDLLLQKGPRGNSHLTTQAKFLADKAGINSEAHFDNILAAISEDGIITFKKMWPVDYWKNYEINISILGNFENYILKIRREYHSLNNSLKAPANMDFRRFIHVSVFLKSISTNPLLSYIFGALIVSVILYIIFLKSGINLSQFN